MTDTALTPDAARGASGLPVLDGRHRIAGAASPSGLALAFADGAFVVQVRAGEGIPLTLGSFPDEEVVAIWRSMARDSGLPLLLPAPDGSYAEAYPQLGRLLLGRRRDRRHLAVLSGRRPRFLVKRRPARLPPRPRVHREREIAAGRSDGG